MTWITVDVMLIFNDASLQQTLTVFVTTGASLVSVKPLSATQVSSPAIALVTEATSSLSVSPDLVTSAMSGLTSQDRSGGGLPEIILEIFAVQNGRASLFLRCSCRQKERKTDNFGKMNLLLTMEEGRLILLHFKVCT